MKIFILYPNQLFKNISNFVDKKVLLIEEPLFFTQYDFHIQKLILHRASMKFYENYLKQKNILVEYFEDESYLELYKDEEIFVYCSSRFIRTGCRRNSDSFKVEIF